jgi:hypothetical protein
MIIWRGAGLIVVAIVFCCNLVVQLLCNKLSGTPTYWDSHAWPLAAGFTTSGIVLACVGALLERRPGRVLVDPATGERIVFRKPHDLFFVPMKYWGVILLVLASVVLATDHKPGPPKARAADPATVTSPH